jgi:DNA-binding transcriptional regulator YbjK
MTHTSTEQPEALRLARKFEEVGFMGDHRFAKDHWCRQAAAELRHQHARIEELEAQLSAIGAGGVEPLRKREAAPQAVQAVQAAVPVGTKFFSFDPCDDLVSHDTAEAACAAAQQSIDLYQS